jgi:hypothetical protein
MNALNDHLCQLTNNIIDQYKWAGMRVRAWWLRFNWNNMIRYRYSKSKYRFVYVVFRINEVSRQPAIHRVEQIFFAWLNSYSGSGLPHYRDFTITLKCNTLGRSPLAERSARRRDLYLITHNLHERQDIQASGGIRTRNPANPRLRPRGHR